MDDTCQVVILLRFLLEICPAYFKRSLVSLMICYNNHPSRNVCKYPDTNINSSGTFVGLPRETSTEHFFFAKFSKLKECDRLAWNMVSKISVAFSAFHRKPTSFSTYIPPTGLATP